MFFYDPIVSLRLRDSINVKKWWVGNDWPERDIWGESRERIWKTDHQVARLRLGGGKAVLEMSRSISIHVL
jgi:hypothetical protein